MECRKLCAWCGIVTDHTAEGQMMITGKVKITYTCDECGQAKSQTVTKKKWERMQHE